MTSAYLGPDAQWQSRIRDTYLIVNPSVVEEYTSVGNRRARCKLQAVGRAFERAYPVQDNSSLDDLLQAIDNADDVFPARGTRNKAAGVAYVSLCTNLLYQNCFAARWQSQFMACLEANGNVAFHPMQTLFAVSLVGLEGVTKTDAIGLKHFP